jgi:hypothetical protein
MTKKKIVDAFDVTEIPLNSTKKIDLINKVIQITTNDRIRNLKADSYDDRDRLPRLKTFQVLARSYRCLIARSDVVTHGLSSTTY